MSDIETNEQAGDERDRLQQLLCAYVLGEADAAERAEVEQALANDAALREERDRLAATVGLVKHTLGRDETLSWRATSAVTQAAAQIHSGHSGPAPREIAWYRKSSFRAAASFVAVVGGAFLGWQAFVAPVRDARLAPASEALVAQLEKRGKDQRDDAARARSDEGDASILRSVGYGGGSAPAGDPALAAASSPGKLGLKEANGALEGKAAEAKNDKLLEQQLSKESALALRQRAEELKRFNDAGGAPAEEAEVYLPMAKVVVDDKIERFGERSAEVKAGNPVVLHVEGATSSNPASGYDEYFLGRANLNPAPAASTPPPASLQPGVAAGGAGGGPATPGALTGSSTSLGKYGGTGTAKKSTEPAAEKAKEPNAGGTRLPAPRDAVEHPIGGLLDVPSLEEAEAQLADDVTKDLREAPTDFETYDRFAGGEPARDDDEARKQRRIWTPEERRLRAEQIVASCKRLPNERPRDMFFRFWGDNPFEWTANDRQSTFAMDVDTASYTLARKYLVENQLPEKSQIRTEEFVNYFKPDVAPPSSKGGGTFTIATELAPSRFSDPRDNKWMLRVAVRGMEIARNERAPLALTLVVDVSGSMKEQNRLELVKHAMRQLVGQLDARDSIAIVAFSSDARLILPMTSAGQRALIESAIDPLRPDQSTNTEAGLRMGYEQAVAALAKNTINRVVLLTDGVANVGIVDPNVLVQSVERQRQAGIYLNTIGVGMNNHNDNLLEQLADKGDGLCNYVDDAAEVKKVLVDDLLKTLVPIARDAKVQVEFDPAQVESYRLLGYENRAIADRDFRNDKVDAGEINSGHQITALYEIVRTGNPAASEAPLAKVHVRFKPPHKDGVAQAASEEASEISSPVHGRNGSIGFEQTSYGYRRAVLAAQFAEFLRRSVHARGDSLDRLIADVQQLAGERHDPETAELADMVLKSRALLDAEFQRRGRIDQAVHDLRHSCFEQARLEARRLESDRAQLAVLEREIAEREATLRKLLDPPQVR